LHAGPGRTRSSAVGRPGSYLSFD